MRKFRFISLILACVLMIGCLAGCASEAPAPVQQGPLLFATYDEFVANSFHHHPEKDEHMRYACYNNFATIIECLSDVEHLIIPDTYTFTDGEGEARTVPVIAINDGVFAGNQNLKSVTIGQNILRIGANAFNGCTNLSQVKMSNSVNEILGGAFAGCASLKSVIIPPKVSDIQGGTFSGCTSLTKVVVESRERTTDEESVNRTIHAGAFSDCRRLAIMWIPDDINTVANSILGGSTPKPLLCGGDSTASSYFATLQCLDYELVSRDDFDTQARLYKTQDLIDRSETGKTIQYGVFNITLGEVDYYEKLGSVTAGENHMLVAIHFTISHDTMIAQYFDGLNIKCTSTAPGRDNIIADFNKLPIMIPTEVLDVGYPVGRVYPESIMEGVIVLRVSSRFESISIQFGNAEEAFII